MEMGGREGVIMDTWRTEKVSLRHVSDDRHAVVLPVTHVMIWPYGFPFFHLDSVLLVFLKRNVLFSPFRLRKREEERRILLREILEYGVQRGIQRNKVELEYNQCFKNQIGLVGLTGRTIDRP